MVEVLIETAFTAAHNHGPGPHGHDFRVLVAVAAPDLVDDVVVDFHALEQAAGALLSRLAHRDLDSCPELSGRGSGPAALARWLFERLEPEVPNLPGAPERRLVRVEVWDTPRSGAAYSASSTSS